jgi:hypothetical protein
MYVHSKPLPSSSVSLLEKGASGKFALIETNALWVKLEYMKVVT